MAEIAARLSDPACRLLTLVGPGGIGKTRLALEAARQIVCPDGVYFVPLQPLTSPEFIVTAIGDVLHLSFYGDQDVRTQLLSFLQNKHLLLVLDNFEHLLDGTDLLLEILDSMPDVKLLVTSRERLRLREEWVIDVHGLPFPEAEYVTLAEDYSAVQLFTQSTRRIGSTLRAEDTPHVVRICYLVGGIPLAIELAAAWTRAISCQQISHELEHSLDILETSFRNPEPRHRTMRATFEPTWNRLTENERTVFQKLTVFRGGFTREAAEVIAGASLNVLAALVDKSLLRLGANGRYDLHELLRQYGEEKLEVSGASNLTRDTHSAYYARFVNQRAEDMKGRRQLPALHEINADFENIRTAWTWAAASKYHLMIDQMIEGLWLYGDLRDRDEEMQALFRYAEPCFAPQDGAEPHRVWGRLLARANTGQTYSLLETALQIAQQHDDVGEIAFCLEHLGFIVYERRDYAAAAQLLEQSLIHYRRLGIPYYVADILFAIMVRPYGNVWEAFKNYGVESLRLRREIGDKVGTAWSLFAATVVESRNGHFVEAENLWHERIALAHEIGNLHLLALGYGQLSYQVYFTQGDFEKARTAAEEALKIAGTLPHPNPRAWPLVTLGLLACMNENYQDGKALCQQATLASGFGPIADLAAWGLCIAACGLKDYEAVEEFLPKALNHGIGMYHPAGTIGCLPVAAILLLHQDNPVRAVELLALALTHPVRAYGWMQKWPLLARLCGKLERTLESDVFVAAWERGKLLDIDDIAIELRQQFPAVPSPSEKKEKGAGSLIELLTEREREVLRLIAGGFSNQDIAYQLILSVGTVKWYTTQIYGKLGVQNRAQAVRRAQELNLFS